MREIEFRGKLLADVDNPEFTWKKGEWVYGNLIVDAQKCWIVGSVVDADEDYIAFEYYCNVDPLTVGQYTGFKDRGGQKIYTGDILDCSYTNPMTGDTVKKLYVVESVKGYFKSQRIGGVPYDNFPLFLRDNRGIICGNIHDNPELLEVKSYV